jgi:TatD DNase family protein
LLVDTHCHLNFDWFDSDRQAVLQRAQDAGLTHILNPGIDVVSSRQALGLASASPLVYSAVGVHPNDALTWNASTLDDLRNLAQSPRVVAIGEIGLDYYRDRAAADVQRRVFTAQLALAAERGLPVVIHIRNAGPQDRRAGQEVLGILEEWAAGLERQAHPLVGRAGVLHSYSEDVLLAQRAIELGFYIGITGPVTFRKADDLRQVVASLPLERLLIETDSPFLTPHPHRGERNEPAYVRYVAEKIAQIKNLTLDMVAQATTANAVRIFLW